MDLVRQRYEHKHVFKILITNEKNVRAVEKVQGSHVPQRGHFILDSEIASILEFSRHPSRFFIRKCQCSQIRLIKLNPVRYIHVHLQPT